MDQAAEKFLGQFRALLTAAGGVLVSYGMISDQQWQPAIGLMVILASLTLGIRKHGLGWPGVWSTLRKLVNAGAAAAVTWGALNPEHSAAISALVLNILVIASSWQANGGGMKAGKGKLPMLLALAALALAVMPGCAVGYDPGTGQFKVGLDPAMIGAVAERKAAEVDQELQQRVAEINEELARAGKGGGK